MAFADQIELLRAVVEHYNELPAYRESLLRAYRSRDLGRLVETVATSPLHIEQELADRYLGY